MTNKLFGITVKEKQKANYSRKGACWEAGFGGYPGLANTATQIVKYIPKVKIFVEPFAGLGRISKHVTAEKIVLNDLSDYAIRYLKKNFKNAEITQEDYLQTVKKWDSTETYFFFDPPWADQVYEKNPLTKNIRPYKIIYEELHELVKNLKGDWMVAGSVDGPLKKWEWHKKEIRSVQPKIFDKHARTLCCSNLPFKIRHITLENFFGE